MANRTSQHVLSTASSLLGFCLFIITSIHFSSRREGSLIDQFAAIIAVMLAVSCIFSFLSIKANSHKTEALLENIADYIFLVALTGILLVILLVAFNVIQ